MLSLSYTTGLLVLLLAALIGGLTAVLFLHGTLSENRLLAARIARWERGRLDAVVHQAMGDGPGTHAPVGSGARYVGGHRRCASDRGGATGRGRQSAPVRRLAAG